MLNLAVFASGGGTNLQSILDACLSGALSAKVVAVISNNSAAYALERARRAGIRAFHISRKTHIGETEYIEAISSLMLENEIGLIILAGYMKLLPVPIVREYYGRIINIHPALLPNYGGPGMYGLDVHRAVLASKDKHSGATVHIVDEKYDHGPILIQRIVPVMPADSPETLAARVLEIEHQILPMAIPLYIR